MCDGAHFKKVEIMTRDERQYISASRWEHSTSFGSNKPFWGTVQAPTGFGKSFTAVKTIERYFTAVDEGKIVPNDDIEYDVVIVSTLTEVVKQLRELVNVKFPDKNILVTTIQALSQKYDMNLPLYCGLYIIDEVHTLYQATEEGKVFHTFLSNVVRPFAKFAMSATSKFRDKRHQKFLSECPIVDTVTEQECIKNNWITSYIQLNVPVNLTRPEQADLFLIEEEMQKCAKYLPTNPMDGAIKMTRGGKVRGKQYSAIQFATYWAKHNGWDESSFNPAVANYEPGILINTSKKYIACVKARRELLAACSEKLDAVETILNMVPEPAMVFCFRTETASVLAANLRQKGISAAAFHSNIESMPVIDPDTGDYYRIKSGAKKGEIKYFGKSTLKSMFLEAFRSGDLQCFVSVKSANTGLDLKNATLQINLNRQPEEQHIQTIGRVRRFDSENPDKVSIIINLFVSGTSDEFALKRAVGDTTAKTIEGMETLYFNLQKQGVEI